MKLKEAQMLGVLALIAVGIILLCMWGGGSSSSEPKPTASDNQLAGAASSPAAQPDLAELYNELLNAPADGTAAGTSKDANVNMAVGGKTPTAADDAATRTMVERTAPDKIPLTQPKDATTSTPATTAALATTTHVVRSGETLSTISQKYYGTKANWKLILDANSSVVKNAKDLKPNMKLVIPATKTTTARAMTSGGAGQPSLLSATTIDPSVAATAPAAEIVPAAAIAPTATTAPAAASAHATAPAHAPAAAPAPAASAAHAAASAAAVKPAAAASSAPSAPRIHTVSQGDTLFRIALKYYGDGSRFKDVLAANRNVLSNAQDLRPGMKLVIP